MPNRPLVVLLDDYEHAARRLADWSAVEALADLRVHHAPMRSDALREAVQDADALLLMRDRTSVDAALIDAMPKLRYVAFTGTRNNALDLAALQRRGVPVGFTEWGPSKESTCELTWALILAAVKRLPQAVQALQGGQWRDGGALGQALHGERIGLVGLGEIGGRVARVAKAFGMDVVTWSPRMTTERAAEHGARAVSLDELVQTSKVVSLHLVMTDATRELFDATRFAQMRPDAIFVNTSRAGLADESALVAALQAGRPGAAALDVFTQEPLPSDHPLRALPNALLSPHLGFVSQPVFERFYADMSEGVLAWLRGEAIPRRMPGT
ncbi:D-2-hydroxyacid dehydrogenase family protein [Xylophilus sp. Kf1]|nr:D-2-hydroxyacid dehydrogenase family protein [Xylophilus sp. Kf1]